MNNLSLLLFISMVTMAFVAPQMAKAQSIDDKTISKLQKFGKDLKKSIVNLVEEDAKKLKDVLKKHQLNKAINKMKEILNEYDFQGLKNELVALVKQSKMDQIVKDPEEWDAFGNELFGLLKKYKLDKLKKEITQVCTKYKLRKIPGEVFDVLKNSKLESPLKEIVGVLRNSNLQDMRNLLQNTVKKLKLQGVVKNVLRLAGEDFAPLAKDMKVLIEKGKVVAFIQYSLDIFNEYLEKDKMGDHWENLRLVISKMNKTQLNDVMKFYQNGMADFFDALRKVLGDVKVIYDDVMTGINGEISP